MSCSFCRWCGGLLLQGVADARQLGQGGIIESDVRGGEILGEMLVSTGPRDQQDVRGQFEEPREGELGRGRAQSSGHGSQRRVSEQPASRFVRPAERAERYERDTAGL